MATNKMSDSGSKWVDYGHNPVLPTEKDSDDIGTVFDIGLLHEDGEWRMWNSWRPKESIALSTSSDGFRWSLPQVCLGPKKNSTWETDINRPFVLKRSKGGYAMWYTGQSESVGGWIGLAQSDDGIHFHRVQEEPVMKNDLPWETQAVMTPSIIKLQGDDNLRMYYSAGERYEPDSIGMAHSHDGGYTWTKHGDPVFKPDSTSLWDNYKVTSPHVLKVDDWYYMFYAGFRDVDHSAIGIARSRDGITDWERLTSNPIISPTSPKAWNGDAVYKPFAAFDEGAKRWMIWYNARVGHLERIGVSTLEGKDFGQFVKRQHD